MCSAWFPSSCIRSSSAENSTPSIWKSTGPASSHGCLPLHCCLHFALVFPERAENSRKSLLKFAAVYTAATASCCWCTSLSRVNAFGFVPTTRARVALDQLEQGFLGICFLAAGIVFYLSFRRSRSGVLRQQLKWLTGGTLAGSLPFTLFYILPFIFDPSIFDSATRSWKSWMQFSSLSLVLIPLCFGYAIIRYRLMDVDIIFKRGLAYTAATAAVAAIYFALVALIAQIFPRAKQRTGHRHDRHRRGRLPLSAFPRRHPGAPGPLLLPRSSGLPAYADRIWPHV